MSAYVIFNYLQVYDEEKIQEYRRHAHPTVASYGGRVRVRPKPVECLEGPGSEYLIMVEFDDVRAARAWYDSTEYQQARSIREQSAVVQVLIVQDG
ncbi:DUF1330 domain-containing protein [Pseudomonadota bacterium]